MKKVHEAMEKLKASLISKGKTDAQAKGHIEELRNDLLNNSLIVSQIAFDNDTSVLVPLINDSNLGFMTNDLKTAFKNDLT
jgi:hypothetical protein